MQDRYGSDVLASGRHSRAPRLTEVVGDPGLVVECASSGWCGAIVGWEKTSVGWSVALEDRQGSRRLFPAEPAAFLLEGRTVTLTRPRSAAPTPPSAPTRTASGSIAAPRSAAKVARASRIWVEGTHDAELVEKVWGADLRELGVVVEPMGGIDDLVTLVSDFEPGPQRRLVVLVDHLVPGTKETRIAAEVTRRWAPHVCVLGHPYVDVWQAVRPAAVGIDAVADDPAWYALEGRRVRRTGLARRRARCLATHPGIGTYLLRPRPGAPGTGGAGHRPRDRTPGVSQGPIGRPETNRVDARPVGRRAASRWAGELWAYLAHSWAVWV